LNLHNLHPVTTTTTTTTTHRLGAFPHPPPTLPPRPAAASGLFMLGLWALRLQPVPKVNFQFFIALMPVALFHTIGHVSACLSFSQMAVSFAHIVKSAEPVFSVALSGPLLGQTYPYYVWLSLLPIVAGCSLSAMKEISFAWSGFNYAMVSNLGMVLRNIYSKKSLTDYKVGGRKLGSGVWHVHCGLGLGSAV
jgi:solute carrier family 35 protein E1